MPAALDLGGSPVSLAELQAAVEDHSTSLSAEFDAEHDSQGLHTKPFQELEVEGATALGGALTVADDVSFTGRYDVTLTTDTHNLQRPDGRPISAVTIRLQATTAVDLSGLVPPTDFEHLRILENGGNETITLLHNNSGSSAANRFNGPSAADVQLRSGDIVLLKYDPSSGIWRLLVGGGQGVIASVQRGTFTIPGLQPSDTQTITSVDTTKADLSFLGAYYATGASIQHWMPGVILTFVNSTTIQATRTGGTSGEGEQVTVAWQVVEYI